ncbi:hypothetical protein ACFQYP_11340 [Nonomuraea antimicrobica]
MSRLSAVSGTSTAFPKYKAPKVFGTTFQADPGHDFTKHISSRRNGILRGWITYVNGGVAEYEPIRWRKGTKTEGHFEGPPEGDVTAYSSPVAKDVIFLSAYGCAASMTGLTVDRDTGLGAKRCSRATLIERHDRSRQPALITVHNGQIVQVQEIYTPDTRRGIRAPWGRARATSVSGGAHARAGGGPGANAYAGAGADAHVRAGARKDAAAGEKRGGRTGSYQGRAGPDGKHLGKISPARRSESIV